MADFAPGGIDSFIPTLDAASGGLQVEFSRNPKRFALNRWAKVIPVSKEAGYYVRIDSEEAMRIVSTQEFVWPKGQDRPSGKKRDVTFVKFTTERYEDGFRLPRETVQQAMWDIIGAHARMPAQRMMTLRTMLALTLVTTSSNWDSAAYSATGTAVGGGAWTGSSEANQYIKSGINAMAIGAVQRSGGTITLDDLVLVMNPNTALALSKAEEIRAMVRNTQYAQEYQRQSGIYKTYGLPPDLYGVPIVIEDTVKVTARKKPGTARTKAWALADNKVFMVSRPGGLVGTEGVPEFSTVQVMCYEDMSIEADSDSWNRVEKGSVVDNHVPVLAAPILGHLVDNISS